MTEGSFDSDNSQVETVHKRGENVVSRLGGVADIGFRAEMEDTNQVLHPFRSPEESFIAVYDGFGGKDGSRIAQEMLHTIFRQALDQGKSPREAIEQAFAETDQVIEAADSKTGSAAVVIYLRGKYCLVANAGDARVVMERKGTGERISRDHKPDDPEERERIEKAGGHVTEPVPFSAGRGKPARVEGVLAISRALGSKELGKLVSNEPTVSEFELGRGDTRAILASDGLWNFIEDQTALDKISKMKYPKAASEYLLREAQKLGSRDNITVIVVDFKAIRG